MLTSRLLLSSLSAVLTVSISQFSLAQEVDSAFDVGLFEEAVPSEHAIIEEAAAIAHSADEHAHDEDAHAKPVTVRTAPEEASATLSSVTWELLSRMAAQLFSGNRAKMLSENEPELLSENQTNLASGNELEVLSGNKVSIFSNIKIDIHVTGVPNPAEMMRGRREVRIETSHAPRVEFSRDAAERTSEDRLVDE